MIYCLNNKVNGSKHYGNVKELDSLDLQGHILYDNVWYWYVNGGYDGSGEIIVEYQGKWYYKSLGHCSCNSPLDGLNDLIVRTHGADSIGALVSQFTHELQVNTKILTDAIRGIVEPNLNATNDGF